MDQLRCLVFLLLFLPLCVSPLCSLCLCGSSKDLDPAAWGSDHVGKPVPEYVTGDECLFCHRMDVGPSWSKNRHHRTIREAEADSAPLTALTKAADLKAFAKDVQFVLGGEQRQRFLKRSEKYGQLELLSCEWVPPASGKDGKLIATERPHWDAKKFGDNCAGCHATGVDVKKRAFSALSLDCYVCHGDADPKHSKDTTLVHLAKKRKDEPRVVTSICAQCHIRSGKSSSTGLPYPNNFVAGDNLFRDFKVDLSPERIKELNSADRHVLDNIRDVVILGKEDLTCLSCHDIHKQSARKHHAVTDRDYCLHCHNATGSKKVRKPFEVYSALCGY